MGIQVDCTECGQRMVDGVLQHTKKCSANKFMQITSIGQMPPGQTIHFDTPEEQQAFMDKLKSGSSATKRYKIMPDQPTPQPSGRTAQEILDYADPNHPARFWRKQAARRHLLDAMLEIVGPDLPNLNGAPSIVTWNRRLAELRERLRLFFAQPTVNDQPPTADSRAGGVDGSGGEEMHKPIVACPDTCKFDWQAFHKQLDVALAHMIEEQDILLSRTLMMEFLTYSFEKTKLAAPPRPEKGVQG